MQRRSQPAPLRDAVDRCGAPAILLSWMPSIKHHKWRYASPDPLTAALPNDGAFLGGEAKL